jgi:predicted phosphodiesterase
MSRVAALYDIHGNLPALDAVLQEIRAVGVDQIVVGGDVVPGPMPRETLTRLLHLEIPVRFLYGNGERAVLAQMAASDPRLVTYWGSASGAPIPEPHQEILRWTARQLDPDLQRTLDDWPKTVTVPIDGLGDVLFCHSTPRSETEIFTRVTDEARLRPVFATVDASLVVCGHTHMPFDRTVGRTRVVNAGSVGMPFGAAGADWLLLGPDVGFRHTSYDLVDAAERVRRTSYPQAENFAAHSILQPPSEAQMREAFAAAELSAG